MDFNWSNKTILIVEDEAHSTMILKAFLRKTNAIIHHVENGQKSVDFCTSNKNIDLILMDISMPVKSGIVAAKEIKILNPDIKIIAQTAFSSKDFVKKCLDAGCDNYISKPIKRLKLLEMLSEYLDS